MPVDARRVQAVFLAAVEAADPVQLAAILDRECASDPELRRRVEALLQAHREPASVLDRPAVTPPEPPNSAASGPVPPAPAGSWASTVEMGSFAGGEPPGLADDRAGLGFLEPPTKTGALGRLGHYEVLEVLGRGGFGIVLRAFDEVLQRVVAVKILAPHIAATSPARKRFLREARSSAQVRHENVVQIHAVGEHPLPFLVMEFIPGQTLQQLLDRTGPLEVPEILRIGLQIAEGLAAAHGTGLIHRDVKPSNVLIEGGPQRRVKLTDFGLARTADDASLSQSGLVAGTPLYMAPEQARGEALDPRADLFSLGSVLYVMCTGRPPFRANGTMAILKRVCEDTPRPIREIIPEAPPWLCDLIGRLHAKDPAERFQSARDVADLLQRYQVELAAHGRVHSSPAHPVRPKPSRGMLLAAAALLLSGLTFGLYYWSHPGSDGSGSGPPQTQPWRPRPALTADELARLPSPFDGLESKDIPTGAPARIFGGADKSPPGLVAVLDGSPSRIPRPGRTSWFAQDRAGKWLAVGCVNDVVLFNARTMAPERILGPAAGPIYQLAFSRDGKRLATGSWAEEDAAAVWDVEKGAQTLRLKQKGNCFSIQFSPDGKRLLTVGDDHKPTVWDADSGEQRHQFPAQDQPVCYDVAFTPDGKHIVTHGDGGAVRVWNAKTWGEVITLPGPERVTENLADWWHLPLAVSPDGKWLAAGSPSRFKIWATADWKEQSAGGPTPATWLAFTPDGRTLLTAAHDCTDGRWHAVARWDTESGRPLPSRQLGSRGAWAVYHLSADGKTLYGMACEPPEPSVRVYDAETLEERVLPGHAGRVRAVDVSPDGTRIASAGADGTVRLWDVTTRRLRHTVARVGKTGVQAVFSPDGKMLYAGWSEDGVIRAIDAASGQWREVGVYGPELQRLAVSPDGSLLAAAGVGGVRLWALPGGTPRGELRGVPPAVAAIAFSPDAKTLAVGGLESVRLFDAPSGHSRQTLDVPGAVRWVAFRPSGRSLAVASESAGNPVLLFDATTGTQAARLEGHDSPVRAGAWRADGELLATVGEADGTVRLWDFGHAVPRRRAVAVFRPKAQSI